MSKRTSKPPIKTQPDASSSLPPELVAAYQRELQSRNIISQCSREVGAVLAKYGCTLAPKVLIQGSNIQWGVDIVISGSPSEMPIPVQAQPEEVEAPLPAPKEVDDVADKG